MEVKVDRTLKKCEIYSSDLKLIGFEKLMSGGNKPDALHRIIKAGVKALAKQRGE